PSLEVREEPSFSPNGRNIAVTGSDENGPGLFLVSIDGGAPVRLYDKLCYHPLWSPDGQYVLFSEYFQGPLMRVNAVSTDRKPVVLPEIRFAQPQVATSPVPYRFLPDGKSLVMQDGGWGNQQFWLVNLETGQRRQLTDLHAGRSIRGFDVAPD